VHYWTKAARFQSSSSPMQRVLRGECFLPLVLYRSSSSSDISGPLFILWSSLRLLVRLFLILGRAKSSPDSTVYLYVYAEFLMFDGSLHPTQSDVLSSSTDGLPTEIWIVYFADLPLCRPSSHLARSADQQIWQISSGGAYLPVSGYYFSLKSIQIFLGWATLLIGTGLFTLMSPSTPIPVTIPFQMIIGVGLGLLFANQNPVQAPHPESSNAAALSLLTFVRNFAQVSASLCPYEHLRLLAC